MCEQDAFNDVLVSLHEAAFDDARWPAASRCIDEACAIKSNSLLIGQGPENDIEASYVGFYVWGERYEEIEREYLVSYHPHDERVPRLRQLPDSRVVPARDLYNARELKISPTYNEHMLRSNGQNSLNVRLVLSPDSYLVLALGDPLQGDAWTSSQIEMIEQLLPHVRQFARVRRALIGAGALATSLAGLLDNTRVGVIHLDHYGRVVAVNDPAGSMFRRENGLRVQDGSLSAWLPADNTKLGQLLGRALPVRGRQASGGSMVIWRMPGTPGLILHIHPVTVSQMAFGSPSVAVLVLVSEVARRPRVDAGRVADALELTPAQSRVAVLLTAGKTLREIAVATNRREGTIRSHVKQIHRKLGISRRVDLARLVLSVGAFSGSWNPQ